MRAVLQRVSRARVTVEERVVAEIAAGLMILLGVGTADTAATATSMAEKIANLRIFEDDDRQDEPFSAGCKRQRYGRFAIYTLRRCTRAKAPKLCGRRAP